MFNWFKSKVELKNEKSIMSSVDNKKGLKIGSEIIVPDNFECLIYNKGHCFNCLTGGKYKLDKSTFEILIKSQQKTKSKLKKVKFVSHFVSLLPQQIEFKYKKLQYKVNFCIDNTAKFAELMLLYSYKVDDSYVYNYIIEIFEELLTHCNFNCDKIDGSALQDFGISISSFDIDSQKVSIFNLSSKSNIVSIQPTNVQINEATPQHFPSSNDNTTIKQDNVGTKSAVPQAIPATNQSSQNENPIPKCPKCGNVTKFATTYCLKCGYKLK